jgi:hypothetical protein
VPRGRRPPTSRNSKNTLPISTVHYESIASTCPPKRESLTTRFGTSKPSRSSSIAIFSACACSSRRCSTAIAPTSLGSMTSFRGLSSGSTRSSGSARELLRPREFLPLGACRRNDPHYGQSPHADRPARCALKPADGACRTRPKSHSKVRLFARAGASRSRRQGPPRDPACRQKPP